jgi:transcriptional regulator with XRE-family HTH domain
MGRPAKPIDTSDYAGRFSARLRELRQKTGLTGIEMATAITSAGFQCAERTYYSWEAGTAPPLNALPFIALSLGVNVKTILPAA